MDIGARAPEITLGSPDGNVTLSSLYERGAVVLAFLRHFG